MIGGSQVASWEVYPRKHADPDAKKQMAGAGSTTGERASFNYGQDMCGNQRSSALQFVASRGRSEVLLSGYGRVCIARRSCPSLGRKHESRDSLVDSHAVPHGRNQNPAS